MSYSTKDLYTVFNVSHQTIKNWASEFADYLSPTATPETNKRRLYTDDDVRVFDLVSRLKKEGKTYEEVKAALGAGQRGDVPEIPHSIVPVRNNTQLALALANVKRLEDELEIERQMRKLAEDKAEQAMLLAARTEGRLLELRDQLKEARAELADVQLKLGLKFEND